VDTGWRQENVKKSVIKCVNWRGISGFRSASFACKIEPGSTQIKPMEAVKRLAVIAIWLAGFATLPAYAGFRTPESLIRNLYGYYGKGSAEHSKGLPHNAETAEQFFDRSLRSAWAAPHNQPYDFLVQSESWKLGPVAIATLRKQFDKTYVEVSFDNNGGAITLNFIVVKGSDGWVISDIESSHDSLRMFLAQFKR
jgi:hypothetical protein